CLTHIGLEAPAGIICRFDLTLSGARGPAGSVQVFRVGSGFSGSNVDELNARTLGRLAVAAGESGRGFALRDPLTGRNSATFEGTQAITWALNRSGHSISYAAPDGTREPVAPGHMDVWVGRARMFDEMAVTSADAGISDLKWYWGGGAGATAFDHLEVAALEEASSSAVGADGPAAPAPAVDPVPGGSTLRLYAPTPNPFERTTRFAYAISGSRERVDIGVFDLAGRRIRGLIHEVQVAGRYEV